MFRVRSQAHPECGNTATAHAHPRRRRHRTSPTGDRQRLVSPHPQSDPIGRGQGADIQVDDSGVSRAHAEIVLGLPVVIRDLGSTNGTLVEGRKITESPHNGARIQVGSTVITYREV